MKDIPTFTPDLIVECTTVCDTSCAGCYAPNTVTRRDPRELIQNQPDKFLTIEALRRLYEDIPSSGRPIPVISLRGGEPTLHPDLPDILAETRKNAQAIFLETNGLWLNAADERYNSLLPALTQNGVTVKISFDSMHHELKAEQLLQAVQLLDNAHIPYVVAVTEPSFQEFQKVRDSVPSIEDSHFVFQQKVARESDLVQPPLGVIHVDGSKGEKPLAKQSFKQPELIQIGPLRRKPSESGFGERT